jgi:hypothetical protein
MKPFAPLCLVPVVRDGTVLASRRARRAVGRMLLAGLLLATGPLGGKALGGSDLYVDGGCEVSGDGSVVAPCARSKGGPGPFKRISTGVEALGPGRTLYVRGRHDRFDGIYRGEYLAIYGQHHLDCRSSRCTIRGYENERPLISGFKTYGDWQRVSPKSPVWFRDMERHDECQGLAASGGQAARASGDADWDPQLIVQDRGGGVRVPLQYNDHVADARFVEERLKDDGSWWHDLAAHRSYVNPYGDGNPNDDPHTVLLVPQEQAQIVIEGSGTCGPDSTQVSHNLLVKQIALEGARSKFVEVNGKVGEPASDLRFEGLSMRFTGGRFAVHTQRLVRFGIQDWTAEWIGRGLSWANHAHAFRTFRMDDATLDGITCRHLGTDNKGQRLFLDPPWANALTSWWWGGTCIQIKQSSDVKIHDLVAEDLSLVGVAFDVSRRSVLDGFDIRRAAAAVGMHEFTPVPETGCDERNPEHFCHNYDNVVRNGVIHASGIDGAGAIVVERNQHDAHKKLQPGQFTARIYNVAITYPGAAALVIRDIDAVSLWNVSIYGDMASLFPRPGRLVRPAKGVMLLEDVERFESRNNIFSQLGDVAIDVESPVDPGAAGGVSFDHDLFDRSGPAPLVRWHEGYATLAGPPGFQETGQERHGKEGSPRFTGVPGSVATPPDLHVAPDSAAAAMGAALSDRFATDAGGGPRRAWDAGAYAVSSGGAHATVVKTRTRGVDE